MLNVFEHELSLIANESIRSITEGLLRHVPAYFWHVPASSSGKYHPAYALGEGGLVRHTKAAVKFAEMLFNISDFTADERDFIVAALLLHDCQKQGDGTAEHTVFEHPLLAAGYVKDNAPSWYADKVCPLIASHMGQWNTSKYAEGVVLPVPQDSLQKFVHECDYLASRKAFEVSFE